MTKNEPPEDPIRLAAIRIAAQGAQDSFTKALEIGSGRYDMEVSEVMATYRAAMIGIVTAYCRSTGRDPRTELAALTRTCKKVLKRFEQHEERSAIPPLKLVK